MCIMVVDFSILFQLSVLILTYHKYKTLFSVLVLYNISYSIYVYVPILVIGHITFFLCNLELLSLLNLPPPKD